MAKKSQNWQFDIKSQKRQNITLIFMNEINQSFWFFMTDGLKTKSTDDNDNVIYILHKKNI